MKKVLSYLLSVVIILTLVMAPSVSGLAQSPPKPVRLNVAYMPNYAALWAVVTGINKGYFAEQAITVNLYEFADGPTEIAAMESGSIDIAYIGPGAHRLCSTGNASVFLLQHYGNADCVIGLSSHGVNKLEDLKGKKVAYASGTSSETILKLALNSVGLTFDDIVAYDMDTSNMVLAMLSGSVDASATWSPNSLRILSELEGDAIKFVSNVDFIDTAVSPASWITTPRYAEKNEDILVRFTTALYKAMDYGSKEENFAEVAKWVAEQTATSFESAYDQRGDGAWVGGEEIIAMAKDGSLKAAFQLQQDAFIADGLLDPNNILTVDDFVLTDIMIKAGANLY